MLTCRPCPQVSLAEIRTAERRLTTVRRSSTTISRLGQTDRPDGSRQAPAKVRASNHAFTRQAKALTVLPETSEQNHFPLLDLRIGALPEHKGCRRSRIPSDSKFSVADYSRPAHLASVCRFQRQLIQRPRHRPEARCPSELPRCARRRPGPVLQVYLNLRGSCQEALVLFPTACPNPVGLLLDLSATQTNDGQADTGAPRSGGAPTLAL